MLKTINKNKKRQSNKRKITQRRRKRITKSVVRLKNKKRNKITHKHTFVKLSNKSSKRGYHCRGGALNIQFIKDNKGTIDLFK